MPSTATPSGLLNEALASFSQAAYEALSAAENNAKAELTQALANEAKVQRLCDQLNEERGQAIHDKYQAVYELEQCKREAERWKAAFEKAEVTISHHTETIAQTRREAHSWKEQFMRVDEERCKLYARVDELVAEQLTLNRQTTYQLEPLTPRSQKDSRFPTAKSQSHTLPQTRPVSQPLPRVTRRVHATVEFPVKEEGEDSEPMLNAGSAQPSSESEASLAVPTNTIDLRRAGTPNPSSRRRGGRAKNIDGLTNGGRRSMDAAETDARSGYDDEDEDELMMGVEDNVSDSFDLVQGLVTEGLKTPSRIVPKSSPDKKSGSTGKKRKLLTVDSGRSVRKTQRY